MTAPRVRVLTGHDADAYRMLQSQVHPHLASSPFAASAPEQIQLGAFDDADGQMTGACTVMVTPVAFEIIDIAVHGPHRRRGVGRALIDWVIAKAAPRGLDVWLEVREDNAAARALYGRLGFIETGHRPGYYRDPKGDVDAVLMTKHTA